MFHFLPTKRGKERGEKRGTGTRGEGWGRKPSGVPWRGGVRGAAGGQPGGAGENGGADDEGIEGGVGADLEHLLEDGGAASPAGARAGGGGFSRGRLRF